MDPYTLFVLALAVALGNVVKGVTGFGSAIVATPIVGLVLPPAEAMAAVATSDVLSGAVLLWQSRRDVPWGLSAAALVGLVPLQWLGTGLQASLPIDLVRRLLALVVILLTGLMVHRVRSASPPDRIPTLGGATLVSGAAGLMGGLVGTPGPLLVVWSQRRLPPHVARAWLVAVFAPGSAAFVLMLVLRDLVPPSLPLLSTAAIPASVAGSVLGGWLSSRVDPVTFAWLAASLMCASAAALLLT